MSHPDETDAVPQRPAPRERLTVIARGESRDRTSADSGAGTPDDTPSSVPAESGSTVRQRRTARIVPHAARTANRARRTWFSFAFFPFFAVYVVIDAIRDLRARIESVRDVQIEARPPFRRPDGMPPVAQRSVADIAGAIDAFPFRPAQISTNTAFFRDNGPDALGALLSPNPQVTTIPHMYPRQFTQRLFTGDGGEQISGMQAMHEHRGPAIVICHGLLMTKHFDAIIQLARRAFEQWGFHVVTLDLRGWGQSAWTTSAPASAGYHEGRDIVEVCRELHRDPRVTSVGGIGYSLGGASMLNAAYVSSLADDTPLDGGVVAVSPPTVIDAALDHISTKPHWRDLVEAMSAPWYGIDMEEFCTRASAANFAGEIMQPVLAIHAADDFLVPVHNAYALQDATVDNPWVHVMVRDAGAHVSFGAVDPSWYYSSLRRWVEYWAMPAGEEPADAPID